MMKNSKSCPKPVYITHAVYLLKKGRKDGAPWKGLNRLYIPFFSNLIRPKNLHYLLPLWTRLYTQDLRCALLRAHLIKIFRPNLKSCPVGMSLITFCVKSTYLYQEYHSKLHFPHLLSPFTIISIRHLNSKPSKSI